MSALKVFNVLYGLNRIEKYGLFESTGLPEECRFSNLLSMSNSNEELVNEELKVLLLVIRIPTYLSYYKIIKKLLVFFIMIFLGKLKVKHLLSLLRKLTIFQKLKKHLTSNYLVRFMNILLEGMIQQLVS